MRATTLAAALVATVTASLPAQAQGAPPDPKRLIGPAVVADVRAFLQTEVVRISVESQNTRYSGMDLPRIEALDRQWVAERESPDKPLIAATLSSPLSVYLTRVQAHARGLYYEIFVTDEHGLNVGQSAITSDYWQGDEAKFQKTFPFGPDTVFVDEAEWNEDLGIWVAQLNLTVSDETGTTPIGSATVEINLTELMRRTAVVGG